MHAADSDTTEDINGHQPEEVVLDTLALGFPWATVDPFLVAVHHVDPYPAGNEDMEPASAEGERPDGADPSTPGWSRYYGGTVPGFPQHPHRGFETVTFVRNGAVDHSDSLGATARYGVGDVQWLTAGRGIQHAEMFPLRDRSGPNPLDLFQIWLNLPATDKMVEPYFTMFWREELPTTVVKDEAGRSTEVTVVAGAFEDIRPLAVPPSSWASREEAEVAICSSWPSRPRSGPFPPPWRPRPSGPCTSSRARSTSVDRPSTRRSGPCSAPMCRSWWRQATTVLPRSSSRVGRSVNQSRWVARS